MMSLVKKIRFLISIKTLYRYIAQRVVVKIRSFIKLPPLYPYENVYSYDNATEKILTSIRQGVPDNQRGDNPAFNTNWKGIVERERIALDIASTIKNAVGPIDLTAQPSALSSLENIGYAQLKDKNLSIEAVDRLTAYLDNQKVYPSHVAHFAIHKASTKNEVKAREPFGSYDLQTILKAPGIAQILSDKHVLGLISGHFGCLPTISSMNLFWSFTSNDGKPKGPQHFHRDVDDYKTCTMFINLTDTKADEGAHCYVEKTHTYDKLKTIFNDAKNNDLPENLNPLQKRLTAADFFQLPLNGYSSDKLYNHFFKEQMVNLFGQRGSVIITDNYGIHRGIPSRANDRLILWVSFALTATHTQSAGVKPQQRVPFSQLKGQVEDNKINRYVLRNVLNFNK
jgi:hypothetical protein